MSQPVLQALYDLAGTQHPSSWNGQTLVHRPYTLSQDKPCAAHRTRLRFFHSAQFLQLRAHSAQLYSQILSIV